MSSTTTPPHPKPHKTLACVHCQYRKIKCDRQFPCANCQKARVECKPSTPAPPHKRRRPNQDLLERLARCEQLLKQYADGSGQSPVDLMSSPSSDLQSLGSATRTMRPAPQIGKVVEEGENVRFMDNFIRISFHDELQAMRDMLDVDDGESESAASPPGSSPNNAADLFLGVEESSMDLQELQPDLVNVFKLWQIYLQRIDPLTRVIHVPTLQPIMIDAAADIHKVTPAYQCLVFAVHLMATVALTEEESFQILSMPRDEALNRFSKGAKLALIRLNFMKNHNMQVLQALCLYMLALTAQNLEERHSTWIFGGTVVRIAQQMGYHRDGEVLGLSPYETEMRRRIWWYIIAVDGRHAMMSGLSHAFAPSHWDTKLPGNYNDSELIPHSLEPLVPHEGPTDMAFVSLMYLFQRFVHSTYPQLESAWIALRSDPQGPDSRQPVDQYRALIAELDMQMADFERKNVEPDFGAVHEAASMVRPMFIEKMREAMIPMRDQIEWGTEIFDATDSIFKSFVISHERNASVFKRMKGKGFLWFVKIGFQLDAFNIMLVKLYKRPKGALANRTWNVVETMYSLHNELFNLSEKRYLLQAQLTLKAFGAREKAYAKESLTLETPEYIRRLREAMASRLSQHSTEASVSPRSISQSFSQQATPPYQQMPNGGGVGMMNTSPQYVPDTMDTTNLSIDMWGNLLVDNEMDYQQQTSFPGVGFDYGNIDFGKMNFDGGMNFAGGSTTDYEKMNSAATAASGFTGMAFTN
ncbi:fungal-specific transcription factor domain-containing protein [Xylariaceae sp. FL0255]|nr:fungal-specific transcription factor domain-containing protein [Xylariaceae sp. FL0255]